MITIMVTSVYLSHSSSSSTFCLLFHPALLELWRLEGGGGWVGVFAKPDRDGTRQDKKERHNIMYTRCHFLATGQHSWQRRFSSFFFFLFKTTYDKDK